MKHEELSTGLALYGRSSKSSKEGSASQQKWRAPRTHLHAEMVKKRRDPAKSPKVELEEALNALQAGDEEALERLMRRECETPVPEDWQRRYTEGARAYWDQFYREKSVNFFKDRHYLREEFGELMPPEVLADPKRWVDQLAACDVETTSVVAPSSMSLSAKALQGKTVLLELGCAVGNGLIPMLRANPDLFGIGCDLSAEAVRLLCSKEEYRCGRCLAFPSDITKGPGEQPTEEHHALEEMGQWVDERSVVRCFACEKHVFHHQQMAMEQQQAQMLAEICGADVDSCCAALHQCRGNADAAAALLMEAWWVDGLRLVVWDSNRNQATSEGAPLTTLLEMGYDRRSAEEALRQSKGDLQSAAEILQDVDTRVAPKNPHAGNLGVCAICTEPLNPADAAMRCAGRGGHHYGHAACLAQWVETCQSRNQEGHWGASWLRKFSGNLTR
eukprot:symbB.v1.2.036943.t1/scaffold5336.1/size28330/1